MKILKSADFVDQNGEMLPKSSELPAKMSISHFIMGFVESQRRKSLPKRTISMSFTSFTFWSAEKHVISPLRNLTLVIDNCGISSAKNGCVFPQKKWMDRFKPPKSTENSPPFSVKFLPPCWFHCPPPRRLFQVFPDALDVTRRREGPPLGGVREATPLDLSVGNNDMSDPL